MQNHILMHTYKDMHGHSKSSCIYTWKFYTETHTHTHTHTNTCIHAHTFYFLQTCVHAHIHSHTHTWTLSLSHTHISCMKAKQAYQQMYCHHVNGWGVSHLKKKRGFRVHTESVYTLWQSGVTKCFAVGMACGSGEYLFKKKISLRVHHQK